MDTEIFAHVFGLPQDMEGWKEMNWDDDEGNGDGPQWPAYVVFALFVGGTLWYAVEWWVLQ